MAQTTEQVIGRRYILRESLGAGGMGAVYRATDRLTGTSVALKRVIQPDDPAAQQAASTNDSVDFRLALAQEFKVLASLRHPNIISVIDYGFDDERHPYYTMELLENAQTILEAGDDRPLHEQVSLLGQMLQALAYLHRRGIIHRDLKPRNVLVTGGQVKVLDFGLSIASDHNDDGQISTAGTLAYMAPETLMGHTPGESADLYAVGIIAYELLAGRHPYMDEDISVLLNNVLYAYPDTTHLGIDSRLSLVLERLLAKTSEARYSSAAEVMKELSAAAEQPLPVETAATRESFLQAARLVGRDSELQQLSDAMSRAMEGHGGSSWLIGGESGVGKSRFVEELRALAMVRGAFVLRGQSVSEGGSPYQLWRSALRWLALGSDADDTALSTLKALIPDIDALVGRAIPDPADIDPKAAQGKLLDAVEALFRRERSPVVIILEDLHWSNESLELLNRLNQIVSDLPLLIIGSYRDDERPELPSRLPGMNVLRLERLSQGAIAELSAAMLGENGRQQEVVDLLHRETEGNVFFLVEVVRALAEEAGTLESIGMTTLPAQVFVGGIQRIIARRLSRIPPEDYPLLQVAAVYGRRLDLDVLRLVAPNLNLERWLSTCADAAVLEVLDDEWRFAHDKLRDGVLAELTPTERKILHSRAAAALEALNRDSVETYPLLAHHYAQAENNTKEAHYSALAGTQALRSGAYHDAIAYLERTLNLLAVVSSLDLKARQREQVSLKRLIAGARLGLGEYGRARELYEENLVFSKAIAYREGVAESLVNLGDVAVALSEFDEARTYYQNALAIYRELGDGDGVAKALNSLGNVAYETGAEDEARRLFQESLNLSRESGSGWGMAGSMSGGSGGGAKAFAAARSAFREAISAYAAAMKNQTARNPLVTAFQKLSSVTTSPEEYAITQSVFHENLNYFRKADDRWAAAVTLDYLGRIAIAAHNHDDADKHLRDALQSAFDDGETALALDAMVAFGRLLLALGKGDKAVELFALALHHPESDEKTQDEAEGLLFKLESELDSAMVTANWEKGKSRTFDSAAREILAEKF